MRSSIWTVSFAVACSLAGCYGDHGEHSEPTSGRDGAVSDAAVADADAAEGSAAGRGAIADAAVVDAAVAEAGASDAAAADAGSSRPDASLPAADSGVVAPPDAGASDTDDGGADEPPVSAAAARLRKIIGDYDVSFIGHVGSMQPQPVEPPATAAVAGDVQFSHTGWLSLAPGIPLPIRIPSDAQFAFGVQADDIPKGDVAIQNPLALELATPVVGPPGTFGLFTDLAVDHLGRVPDTFESCSSGAPFQCAPVFRPKDTLPPLPAGETDRQPAWMMVHVDGDAASVHVVAELVDRGGRQDLYGSRAFCTMTKLVDGSDSWNQLKFALHATVELRFQADGGVSGTIKGRARAEDGTVSGEALFEAMVAGVKRLPPAPP